jgi:transcriptional regulator with XRE-family HTH domain
MEEKLMITLDRTSYLYEIENRQPIPLNKLAYFQSRLRYRLHDYIITKFKEMEKNEGLTRAELARRIGCKPELVTRRFGAPGNWTLDTISDLLIGIAGEELEPQSISVLDRTNRNTDEKSWRESNITCRPHVAPSEKQPRSVSQFNDNRSGQSALDRNSINAKQLQRDSRSIAGAARSAIGDIK